MKSSHTDFYRTVHCVMGLPFDALTLEQATERVRKAAFNGTPCFFSTPNLNFLIASQSNTFFRQSVLKSDLSLPDGMPIVWMSKLMGIPITERVAGSDVFDALRKSSGRKIKVYFFGGQPGVAERAMSLLNAENGGLECVGYESPGFGSIAEMSSCETIEKINASGAEFLVVSLGAVKGQAWIEHNLAALRVPVISHLGAVLNFVAGSVSRAPRWMQKVGLEWVWRIVEEPTLWKRYSSDAFALIPIGLRLLSWRHLVRMFKLVSTDNTVTMGIHHSMEPEQLRISVAGACVQRNLAPLRELLSNYADQQFHITMNVEAVSDFDSAFLGLLALLCGQQLNRGKSLKIVGQTSAEFSFDVATDAA